jgi:aspartyl-tRNA(Asn)/glutamyl-tRNA(Gln) amidotransferase subunit A
VPSIGDLSAHLAASSVRLLKTSGAIIVGKTYTQVPRPGAVTLGEDARGEHAAGPVSGAALAVAKGMSLGAVAADAQLPLGALAVLSGVVGCKPTFGLSPSDGMAALSWSLDQVGHMAATVEDAALLLDVLDPHPHVQYSQGLHKDMRGVRIGVPPAALEGAGDDVRAALHQAVAALRQAGAAVVETETPAVGDFEAALGLWLVVREAEAAAYHDALGVIVSAIHYLQAQRAREDLRWRMLRCFDRFDALLMPTTGAYGTQSASNDGNWDQHSLLLAQNCILWSFVGFPTVSLPCAKAQQGVGIGAQLVAAPYEDARLLSIAAALELELSRG